MLFDEMMSYTPKWNPLVQDRYIFATMVLLVTTCFWHGSQTVVDYDKYPDADWIAMVILAGCYIIYNIQFIMRLLLVVNDG